MPVTLAVTEVQDIRPGDLYRSRQVAELFGVRTATVRTRIQRGRPGGLPPVLVVELPDRPLPVGRPRQPEERPAGRHHLLGVANGPASSRSPPHQPPS